MKIVKVILQALLIAQFSFFGVSKVIGSAEMVTTFDAFGYPGWSRILVGLIELCAVALLAYGFFKGETVKMGAGLIAILTVGAAFSHAVLEGSIPNAIIPLVVLAQTGLMLWLHNRTEAQPALR